MADYIVSSGVTSVGITLTGEIMHVQSGGTATIAFNPWQSGDVTSETGAVVTSLERDANVYVSGTSGFIHKDDKFAKLTVSNGKITVDLNSESAATAMIENLNLMNNLTCFSVETEDAENGTYTLASGASDFNGSITLENEEISLSIGEYVEYSDHIYALNKNDDELLLSINGMFYFLNTSWKDGSAQSATYNGIVYNSTVGDGRFFNDKTAFDAKTDGEKLTVGGVTADKVLVEEEFAYWSATVGDDTWQLSVEGSTLKISILA